MTPIITDITFYFLKMNKKAKSTIKIYDNVILNIFLKMN